MNAKEFLRMAWRCLRRHRLNLDIAPDLEEKLVRNGHWGRPPDAMRQKGHGHPGIRSSVRRRSRRGFVGDDVRISMYLGTRGHRSF